MEGTFAATDRSRRGFSHHCIQDEAYELGYQWAKLYEPGSQSRKLVTEVMDEALLVNIVHNNFHEPHKIFEPFFNLEEELRTTQVTIIPNGNGHPNGHSVNGTNGYSN